MYLSIICSLQKSMTILGWGSALIHAYGTLIPKIQTISIQPLAIIHCNSLRIVTIFLSSFWHRSLCWSLALPSCWWVEGAYAKFRGSLTLFLFLASLAPHGFAWQYGNSNEVVFVFVFLILLLGFQFHLSFFHVRIKLFSLDNWCDNS